MADVEAQLIRSSVPCKDEEFGHAFENFLCIQQTGIKFLDSDHTIIWQQITSHFINNGKMLSKDALRLKLQQDSFPDAVAALDLIFTSTSEMVNGKSLESLADIQKETESHEDLKELLFITAEIAKSGKKISTKEKGRRVTKTVKGVKDAASYLLDRTLNIIDQHSTTTHVTVKEGVEELKGEYLARKADPSQTLGILTGIETIDMRYRGLAPGDLALIGGFTGVGKSTMAMNWSHQAMVSGYNVLYISLEMDVEKCRRSLACIHSAHEKFHQDGGPLNYSDIKNGTLSPSDEQFYLEQVLPSLKSEEYGDIRFESPSALATLEDLMAMSEVLNRQQEIDMIVVDYLGLVSAHSYNDYKDNLNVLIKIAKNWAMSFDNGRGVPIISPWQMNRHGYDSAKKNDGVYELTALTHASEAERSSDLIIALYTNEDLRAMNRAKMTCLKTRDCEPFPPTDIYVDYAARIFADEQAVTDVDFIL